MCPSFGHGMLTQKKAFAHIPHISFRVIMQALKKHDNKKDTSSANLTNGYNYFAVLVAQTVTLNI